MLRFYEKKIQETFKGQTSFSRNELNGFYKKFEPNLNEGTFGWRIYDLKKKRIIEEVKRGIYSISTKEKFKPILPNKLIRLAKVVAKDFTDLEYCVWTSEWLNTFTRHQLGNFFYIIEVEKDFIQDVFNAYKEIPYLRVFINPDKTIVDNYLDQKNTLILKSTIGRAPLDKFSREGKSKSEITVPSLEKILVDIYCEEVLFSSIRGQELNTIFDRAIKHYSINYTTLLSYAQRRGREEEIKSFLLKHFQSKLKGIIE